MEKDDKSYLLTRWGIDGNAKLESAIESALLAKTHSEFFELGSIVHLPREQVRTDVVDFLKNGKLDLFDELFRYIENMLELR